MKTGQYTVTDGKFRFRYLVHKIMKKTADVSVLTSIDHSDFRGNRCCRYPLDLLESQTTDAEYICFKKDEEPYNPLNDSDDPRTMNLNNG